MPILIYNVLTGLDTNIEELKKISSRKLGISETNIDSIKILRESIDARKKESIKLNYVMEVSTSKEEKLVKKLNDKDVRLTGASYKEVNALGKGKLLHQPVIVGMGPAGLFAGFLLAKKGYKPIIFERGENVLNRNKTINNFWRTGKLNTESNVQFGEGGAGTFSDGKLNTRIKDYRCDYVLEAFAKAGAPEEIVYSGKPHIGTDILKDVVKNLREQIISLGGEVHFNSKFQNIIVEDNRVKAIVVEDEEIPCEAIVLALGHSSRDTYEMLYRKGLAMEKKAFAIGLRVEHPQSFIDEAQYGKFASHPKLKAADYRLTHTGSNGRAVYSFCMCPGGEVVAAASEENRLVTNGMSLYNRNKANSNSAIVVGVNTEDFDAFSKGVNYPLAGMEFQRHYENQAFILGGGGYIAPVQLLGDFLSDNMSKGCGEVKPSYAPGYSMRMLRECLPSFVTETIKEGFHSFDKKIKGFAREDAVLTGIETRTSAPIRLLRDESLQSVSIKGVYPAGEGAGYAGGIMSSAVDGMKVAEEIMKKYSPLI